MFVCECHRARVGAGPSSPRPNRGSSRLGRAEASPRPRWVGMRTSGGGSCGITKIQILKISQTRSKLKINLNFVSTCLFAS
jgi:hypothetical protein